MIVEICFCYQHATHFHSFFSHRTTLLGRLIRGNISNKLREVGANLIAIFSLARKTVDWQQLDVRRTTEFHNFPLCSRQTIAIDKKTFFSLPLLALDSGLTLLNLPFLRR